MLDDIKKTLWASADKRFARAQLPDGKLGEQMAKGAELDALIRQKLGWLGYEF